MESLNQSPCVRKLKLALSRPSSSRRRSSLPSLLNPPTDTRCLLHKYYMSVLTPSSLDNNYKLNIPILVLKVGTKSSNTYKLWNHLHLNRPAGNHIRWMENLMWFSLFYWLYKVSVLLCSPIVLWATKLVGQTSKYLQIILHWNWKTSITIILMNIHKTKSSSNAILCL